MKVEFAQGYNESELNFNKTKQNGRSMKGGRRSSLKEGLRLLLPSLLVGTDKRPCRVPGKSPVRFDAVLHLAFFTLLRTGSLKLFTQVAEADELLRCKDLANGELFIDRRRNTSD